jgi:hypothetical protein
MERRTCLALARIAALAATLYPTAVSVAAHPIRQGTALLATTVTPSPAASASPTVSPTPTTSHPTFRLVLHTSARHLRIGSSLAVSVTLINTGSVGYIGLLQYTLSIAQNASYPALVPAMPAPIYHNFAIYPGQSDTEVFSLTAAHLGRATLTALANGEISDPGCGCFYFGDVGPASSWPIIVRAR